MAILGTVFFASSGGADYPTFLSRERKASYSHFFYQCFSDCFYTQSDAAHPEPTIQSVEVIPNGYVNDHYS